MRPWPLCCVSYATASLAQVPVATAVPSGPVRRNHFDDADDGADRDLQMTWTGREAHDQSQGFGQIIFSDEAMAVSAKQKLSVFWSLIKTQQ